MKIFMTNNQLYTTNKITPEFIKVFEQFSEVTKIRILSKNIALRKYYDKKNRKQDYPEDVDFGASSVYVSKVVLHELVNRDGRCPLDGEKLVEKNVTIVRGSRKNIFCIDTCVKCRCFYSMNAKQFELVLRKKDIECEVINEEEEENEKGE